MMMPDRVSMVSYNLWNSERWPRRAPALRQFLRTFEPDLLCLQEVRQETLDCIDETLPGHERVHDKAPGWRSESNIYWNRHYFTKIEHGLEKLDMPEQHRGLFWVRLKIKGSDLTLLVATAHYTWQGTDAEVESGQSPRNAQTRQTISWLDSLVGENEPAFFMGDLNDPFIPDVLFPRAGYHSCFKKLGLLSPPTCPAIPAAPNIGENQVLDWIFSNDRAKVISASVPHTYVDDIAPSDHWPVHAVYQLAQARTK